MMLAAIQDDRIMADGRPAFAWWNEIQMLRQQLDEMEPRRRAIENQLKVLGVVRWVMEQGPLDYSDHLHVWFSHRVMLRDSFEEMLKYAEFEFIP